MSQMAHHVLMGEFKKYEKKYEIKIRILEK